MTPPIRRATVRELARTFGPGWGHRRTMVAGSFYRTVAIAATLLAPWPFEVIAPAGYAG